MSEYCCGGTALRATCEYHSPKALAAPVEPEHKVYGCESPTYKLTDSVSEEPLKKDTFKTMYTALYLSDGREVDAPGDTRQEVQFEPVTAWPWPNRPVISFGTAARAWGNVTRAEIIGPDERVWYKSALDVHVLTGDRVEYLVHDLT